MGYFPDTFGLSGQIPQIVKETGMSYAAFGRGVKPTGFDNRVSDAANFQSTYSEMQWQSPDGSQVLGILFANWYSNGNEIPSEEGPARLFWDQKLKDAEKYAATDHLLMMNGCDHQPVQVDISKAIALANRLYPDYHFIHSNFDLYYKSLPQDQLKNLSTVYGELRSQETDGWYTLANTASSRIYLKQRSHDLSLRLEKVIEPLVVLASHYGMAYPKDQIDFVWLKLLENYPHDSICGCSVDVVHRGMETRFDQVQGILDYLEGELKTFLGTYDFGQRPQGQVWAFQVWNTDSVAKTDQVQVQVELARCLFKEASPQAAYQQMADLSFGHYQVVDGSGKVYPASVTDGGTHFAYDLPKDAFRVPYMARYANVTVSVQDMAPLSVTQLYLQALDSGSEPGDQVANGSPSPQASALVLDHSQALQEQMGKGQDSPAKSGLENDYLKVVLDEDGLLTLIDKVNVRTYQGQCLLEETGDAGNEYIFKEAQGQRHYARNRLSQVHYFEQGLVQGMTLTYTWDLPISGDDRLSQEIAQVIDITNRNSGRSDQVVRQDIQVTLTLAPWQDSLDIHVQGINDVKDHRIRMVWQVDGLADSHWVDSHYEILRRSNQVSKEWRNPSNPQVLRHGVALVGQDSREQTYGLTLSTKGLYEYEVWQDRATHVTYLGLTLLRSTGELGDWGHFDTPQAQCLGAFEGHMRLKLWTGQDQARASIIEARHTYVEPLAFAPRNQSRQTNFTQQKLKPGMDLIFQAPLPDDLVVTALKMAQNMDGWIIRLVNFGPQLDLKTYLQPNLQVERVNLLELSHDHGQDLSLSNHRILTVKVSVPNVINNE